MIERNHFRDNRNIFSGIQRHSHEGDFDVEDRGGKSIETRSIDHCVLIPFLELYDNFDSFLLADRANSKDGWNVDESDAANLHVVALQLVTAPDQHIVPATNRDDNIVGNETMSELDEIEHTLCFSYSAAPRDKKC